MDGKNGVFHRRYLETVLKKILVPGTVDLLTVSRQVVDIISEF